MITTHGNILDLQHSPISGSSDRGRRPYVITQSLGCGNARTKRSIVSSPKVEINRYGTANNNLYSVLLFRVWVHTLPKID